MSRWIILSPHYDDGILSCGCFIQHLKKRADVEIWTIFGGAPWFGRYSTIATWLHSVSGATGKELVRRRQREDIAACMALHVKHRHFRWHDAVYRRGNHEFLYEQCQVHSWHPQDDRLIDQITAEISSDLTAGDQVIAPLAVGNHVDHMIVREVARRLLDCRYFYADVPYSVWNSSQLAERTVKLTRVSTSSNAGIKENWRTACHHYASQIAMLTTPELDFDRMLDQAAGMASLWTSNPLDAATISSELAID